MPLLYGPRCGDCGKPRRMLLGGQWIPIDCGCPRHRADAPPGLRTAPPAHEPDGVHYSTMPTKAKKRRVPR